MRISTLCRLTLVAGVSLYVTKEGVGFAHAYLDYLESAIPVRMDGRGAKPSLERKGEGWKTLLFV